MYAWCNDILISNRCTKKTTLRSNTVLKLPIEQLGQFKKHKLHLLHSVGNFDLSLTYTQH